MLEFALSLNIVICLLKLWLYNVLGDDRNIILMGEAHEYVPNSLIKFTLKYFVSYSLRRTRPILKYGTKHNFSVAYNFLTAEIKL